MEAVEEWGVQNLCTVLAHEEASPILIVHEDWYQCFIQMLYKILVLEEVSHQGLVVANQV